jgi:hypothetical protein
MKRLKNLGYRIIYISKELTGQVTLRGNVTLTTYKPNINDKVANVLAGTVDLTCRAYADDRGRWIGFKVDEYTFGGGRFDFKNDKCELSVAAFTKALKDAQAGLNVAAPKQEAPANDEPEQMTIDDLVPTAEPETPAEETATRRTRRVRS